MSEASLVLALGRAVVTGAADLDELDARLEFRMPRCIIDIFENFLAVGLQNAPGTAYYDDIVIEAH